MLQPRPDTPSSESGISYARTLARLVAGRNIEPQTLLATDYLNHFNEIVMLLELVPDMPECLDEARDWRPKSYQQHFRDSQFSDKELAILAYEHAPARYREAFEETVEAMNRLVADAVERLGALVAAEDADALALTARDMTERLRGLMDRTSAIIHGADETLDQAEIDRVMGG